MDLIEALKQVEECIKKDSIIESNHYKEQCKERNLDSNKIREIIKQNKILGVLEQLDEKYKVWWVYKENKDLNIIVKLINSKKLKLITVFPSYSERRIK